MISYYELLGMIKEVNFPSKVKYNDNTYIWTGRNYRRIGTDNYLNSDIDEVDMVEQNIEIIENNSIQKLKIENGKVIGKWNNGSNYCYTLSAPQTVIVNKINEIIEVLNEKEKIQNNQK